MYLAPLAFLALVLTPGRIGRRTALVSALLLAVVMVWTPRVTSELQQPALFGTQRRINSIGLFHGDVKIGFVVVALVVACAGVIALTSRSRGRGLAIATILVAAVLITQSWTSQAFEIHLLKHARPVVAPRQLDWVDRHAPGPVGMLNLGDPQSLSHNVNLFTDFYNKKVDHMYALVPTSLGCPITLGGEGVLTQTGGPTCAPWPRYLVIERGRVFPTVAGQRVLAETPLQGTLVRIPPGPPRLVGVVQPPCLAGACLGVLGVTAFAPSPGRVAISFGPAPKPARISLAGGRSWSLPPDRVTTLRVPVGGGFRKLVFPVSWSTAQGAPSLRSVALETAGEATRLYESGAAATKNAEG
jgi:hypothetical protein